jgi:hypothetical protein
MTGHLDRGVVERVSLYMVLVFVLMVLVVVTETLLATPPTTVMAAPTATLTAPVQLPPDFRSGVYPDQFGELVNVAPERITYYARDNHGAEWFVIDGQRYYRTPSGALFQAEG